jgi:hypothetical protein
MIKLDVPSSCTSFSINDFYFHNKETNKYDLHFDNYIKPISERYEGLYVNNIISNDIYIISVYDLDTMSKLELNVLTQYAYDYYIDKYTQCCAYWDDNNYFFILFELNNNIYNKKNDKYSTN